MDSLTNVSLIITTLLCFLTVASPTTASPLKPNVTLIQRACNHTIDHEFCFNYLSKNPLVVSASQESPLSLAVAIAELGLTNAQLMREYASNKIVKSAYAECAKLLDDTILQLTMAVNILKRPEALDEVGASEDASQSLMISIDGVTGCNASVKVGGRYIKTSANHVEVYIKTSAKHVEVCSVAADSIVTNLMKLKAKKTNV